MTVSCLGVQPLNSSYNHLLDKMFNTIALAKNLIASIDASETKALPNEFFLNNGFIFASSLMSQDYWTTEPTACSVSPAF